MFRLQQGRHMATGLVWFWKIKQCSKKAAKKLLERGKAPKELHSMKSFFSPLQKDNHCHPLFCLQQGRHMTTGLVWFWKFKQCSKKAVEKLLEKGKGSQRATFDKKFFSVTERWACKMGYSVPPPKKRKHHKIPKAVSYMGSAEWEWKNVQLICFRVGGS